MEKAPQRNYIEPGKVNILNHFFLVHNTTSYYIMMVYYGTSRKINDIPWSNHFSLTNCFTKTRKIQEVNCMYDIEIGDILMNFIIHEYLIKFYGVDVTHMRSSYPHLV